MTRISNVRTVIAAMVLLPAAAGIALNALATSACVAGAPTRSEIFPK